MIFKIGLCSNSQWNNANVSKQDVCVSRISATDRGCFEHTSRSIRWERETLHVSDVDRTVGAFDLFGSFLLEPQRTLMLSLFWFIIIVGKTLILRESIFLSKIVLNILSTQVCVDVFKTKSKYFRRQNCNVIWIVDHTF